MPPIEPLVPAGEDPFQLSLDVGNVGNWNVGKPLVSAGMDAGRSVTNFDSSALSDLSGINRMAGSPAAIGIDLGTTYSCVGIWNEQDGGVQIIMNELGNRTTPSYVSFTDTGQLVGEAAKNDLANNPFATVYDAKRLIGRQFNDPLVQDKMMDVWNFKVVERDNKPDVQVEFKGERHTFSPEEISSKVLTKMKKAAELYTQSPITDAVVTVPAYFNDSQRQATKDAGTIAGLNILQILNEPTAAAIAFGVQETRSAAKRHVLVFDFGGGTHDVTLLKIENGQYIVQATAGDNDLGGQDFTQRLYEHLVKDFLSKHRDNTIKDNARAMTRLFQEADKAKCKLCHDMKYQIEHPVLHKGADFRTSITRARFEIICKDLFHPVISASFMANVVGRECEQRLKGDEG